MVGLRGNVTGLGLLLWVSSLWGCQGNGASEDATGPAPVLKSTLTKEVTTDERRARFHGRKVIASPSAMPRPWARLLDAVEGRLTHFEQRTSTHAQDWRGHRSLELAFRMFGTKDEISQRLLAGLRALDLPGVEAGLPQGTVKAPPVAWSLERIFFRAPAGAEREARLILSWSRTAQEKRERERCRKPKPVDLPYTAPAWLKGVTEKRTTRRRIISQSIDGLEGRSATIWMLYRNGFAHDEHVGKLVELARRRSLTHVAGVGPRQTWEGSKNEVLSWSPVARDLDLGCRIEGPVLAIEYQKSNPEE